jgi:hypothetical protein
MGGSTFNVRCYMVEVLEEWTCDLGGIFSHCWRSSFFVTRFILRDANSIQSAADDPERVIRHRL